MFTKIEYSLKIFKKIEILKRLFSAHNEIKYEINNNNTPPRYRKMN